MNRVVLRGLLAPVGVAAITLVAGALGGIEVAFAVLALGALAIIAFDLWQLSRLSAWTRDGGDGQVPEGRGIFGPLFAAIHRHMRVRNAYERELRHVVDRFRQAASAMPDGIVVLDARNRIDWANARALTQFALDLAKDRGQPIYNLVRQPEFRRYLDAGDYGTPVVVASEREAGRTLALQLVPFAGDQKLLLARDITELEAVARMRRDFIASVSHELKTPLTVINGFIETLQDIQVDERQRRRFLSLMQEQATSMQSLVADLLTLSALESDQSPLHEERFPTAPLLDAIAADARALSKGAHTVTVDAADRAMIMGCRDEIASAFGNLVTNAVRYTPKNGSIRIAWRVDGDGSGVFSVTDTGIGIAAEHIPRLTERFYRVDRSRSRATGGTGLGLAIVKHVLLRHQAELAITSERGKGSTFAVRMPPTRVQRAAAALMEKAVTSTEAPRGTGA